MLYSYPCYCKTMCCCSGKQKPNICPRVWIAREERDATQRKGEMVILYCSSSHVIDLNASRHWESICKKCVYSSCFHCIKNGSQWELLENLINTFDRAANRLVVVIDTRQQSENILCWFCLYRRVHMEWWRMPFKEVCTKQCAEKHHTNREENGRNGNDCAGAWSIAILTIVMTLR